MKILIAKDIALDHLRELREECSSIQQAGEHSHNRIQAWRIRAIAVVRNIFGDDSPQLKDISSVRLSEMAMRTRPPRGFYQRDCTDQAVASYLAYFESFADEVKRFGEPLAKGETSIQGDPRRVFIVHGRQVNIRNELIAFLGSVDLRAVTWEDARRATGKPTPYVGDIVREGLRQAFAVVVLLTGDDLACLHPDLANADDEIPARFELQPRPNVLFEAGLAEGLRPGRVLYIRAGTIRNISDLSGLHFLDLDNSPERRREFLDRLSDAGCKLDDKGTSWLKAGDLEADELRPINCSFGTQQLDTDSLSEKEIELLVAGEMHRQVILLSDLDDVHAQVVIIGNRQMFDGIDQTRTSYVWAFQRLYERGLLEVAQSNDDWVLAKLSSQARSLAQAKIAAGWKVDMNDFYVAPGG